MGSQNRKICLIFDQCATYPKDTTLQNVKLVLLFPNTTSHLQLLDAGIRNAKYHFKSLLVHHVLAKLERKDGELNISVLDVIRFFTVSWDCVSPTTLVNWFAKCAFDKTPEGHTHEPD